MPDATGGDFGLLDPLGQGTRGGELTGDRAWLQAMVDVEVALVRSLIDQRIVPEWMSEVASGISHAADLDPASLAAAGRGGGNPVIPLALQLGKRADAIHEGASDHLHLGATSQDIMDSAAMLVARRAIAEIDRALVALGDVLARLAELHRTTPMAGRTLGQHASPTSFGLVVAVWLDALVGARRRLNAVYSALPIQYGGSVGTLGVLTEVVRLRRPDAQPAGVVDAVVASLAQRLDLRVPPAPWQVNRVPIVELASALAMVIGSVGTMAGDVCVLSRTEIAEVSERLAAGEGSSSAMPHKRNPVTAVLLVSAARRAPGALSTVFASQLAEDQRSSGAWHAEWDSLRQLEKLAVDAAMAAASLAERLEVDVARMRSNLDFTDGLVYSERVSTILAETLGKSAAFDLVATASREAAETHRPLRVVLSGQLGASGQSEELRARVWDAFDPDASLGHASEFIDRVLTRRKEQP
jgi:3-carboxy-cis,cis-muconate cycloisomerase